MNFINVIPTATPEIRTLPPTREIRTLRPTTGKILILFLLVVSQSIFYVTCSGTL